MKPIFWRSHRVLQEVARRGPDRGEARRSWLRIFSLLTVVLSVAAKSMGSAIHTEDNPTWARPTSASSAVATLTTYSEWDGFAITATTNQPTGNSFFGSSLSVPTAGDSSSSSDGSFILTNGTANNAYYSSAAVGDIYSFGGVVTPQINAPGYAIPGNQINVLVQAEVYGSLIDTSLLTVNGVQASTLANYGVSETYTDGGTNVGFGEAYRNDYAWTFTVPSDTSSLQLNFGWSPTSAAVTSLVIDTQSVPAVPVPEPSTFLLATFGGVILWKVGARKWIHRNNPNRRRP